MAFLDLEKAYDCVPRELILKTLNARGVPSRYIRSIRDMYEGAKTRVRTTVGNTGFFPVEVGLHQGSALSPYLFALILDELTHRIQDNIPWCLIFSDDIVLVSDSQDELNRRLEQWRTALESNGAHNSFRMFVDVHLCILWVFLHVNVAHKLVVKSLKEV
ncbi:secreted RxLR effector protein 78-like [Rutidosis leptorrhynchoides]|uniref:secreted RxLR effector protein 78-like n=1 Tax=Rutidosis leptorrhynchoides TaxID=125765 RepID=UPI003A9A4443